MKPVYRSILMDHIRQVSDEYDLPAGAILGRDKHKTVASARRRLYWLLRQRGFSYPEIGMMMDRDHTTIMIGCRKYEEEREQDEQRART